MVDLRSTALTHLVGDSRAYLLQLDGTAAELRETRAPDIDLVLDAIARAKAAVREAEHVGSQRLQAAS